MKKKVKFRRIAESRYVSRGPSPTVQREVVPVRILTKCKGGGTCYRTFYVTPEKAAQYGQGAGALLEGMILAAQAMTGLRVPDDYQCFGQSWGLKHARISGALYDYENLFQYGSSVAVVEDKQEGTTETVTLSGERQITSTIIFRKYAKKPRFTYVSTVVDGNTVVRKITCECRGDKEITITRIVNYAFLEFMFFIVNIRQKFRAIYLPVRSNYESSLALRCGFVPVADDFEKKKDVLIKKMLSVTAQEPINIPKLSRLTISLESAKDYGDAILKCVKNGYIGSWARNVIMSRVMEVLLDGVKELRFDCGDKSISDRILSTTFRHCSINSDIKRGLLPHDLPAMHQQENIFMEI